MNTQNNEDAQPAGQPPSRALTTGSDPFPEHADHLGYAYARDEDDEWWHGVFNTKQEAVENLLSEDWDGRGWISAVRAVSEHDEDADEDWAFICYGPREEVNQNNIPR